MLNMQGGEINRILGPCICKSIFVMAVDVKTVFLLYKFE
jgi:hypothetical protein